MGDLQEDLCQRTLCLIICSISQTIAKTLLPLLWFMTSKTSVAWSSMQDIWRTRNTILVAFACQRFFQENPSSCPSSVHSSSIVWTTIERKSCVLKFKGRTSSYIKESERATACMFSLSTLTLGNSMSSGLPRVQGLSSCQYPCLWGLNLDNDWTLG